MDRLTGAAAFVMSRVGRRRATSTSKIRKTTARRKKRRENGIRAEFFGSNPHSKGVVIFCCAGARIETDSITAASAVVIIRAIKVKSANFTIASIRW